MLTMLDDAPLFFDVFWRLHAVRGADFAQGRGALVVAYPSSGRRQHGGPQHRERRVIKRAARYRGGRIRDARAEAGGQSRLSCSRSNSTSRRSTKQHSSLAIVRDGKVTPLKLGEDANLRCAPALRRQVDAELVFVRLRTGDPGVQIRRLRRARFEGQDCGVYRRRAVRRSGRICGRIIPSARSAGRRCRRPGAIGVVEIPNPKVDGHSVVARRRWRASSPTMELADPRFEEIHGHEILGARSIRRTPNKLFAAFRTHLRRAAGAGGSTASRCRNFPLNLNLRATVAIKAFAGGIAERRSACCPASDPAAQE